MEPPSPSFRIKPGPNPPAPGFGNKAQAGTGHYVHGFIPLEKGRARDGAEVWGVGGHGDGDGGVAHGPPPPPRHLGDLPASRPDLLGLRLLVGWGRRVLFLFWGFYRNTVFMHKTIYRRALPCIEAPGGGRGGNPNHFPDTPAPPDLFSFSRGGSSGVVGRGERHWGCAGPFR